MQFVVGQKVQIDPALVNAGSRASCSTGTVADIERGGPNLRQTFYRVQFTHGFAWYEAWELVPVASAEGRAVLRLYHEALTETGSTAS